MLESNGAHFRRTFRPRSNLRTCVSGHVRNWSPVAGARARTSLLRTFRAPIRSRSKRKRLCSGKTEPDLRQRDFFDHVGRGSSRRRHRHRHKMMLPASCGGRGHLPSSAA
jgi:hypothetical protein